MNSGTDAHFCPLVLTPMLPYPASHASPSDKDNKNLYCIGEVSCAALHMLAVPGSGLLPHLQYLTRTGA